MKRKIETFAIGVISILLLSSCQLVNPFETTYSSQSATNNTDPTNATTVTKNGSGYFQKMISATGRQTMPSVGNAKMLVVPVVFQDNKTEYTSSTAEGKAILSDLNTGFFGTAADTNYWESLSSFYYKSSYGKLNVTGTVTDFFYLGQTVASYQSEIKTAANTSATKNVTDITNGILEEAYNYFFNNKTYDYNEYDSDGNGIIDSIHLVYCYPYTSRDATSLLWAYTYWDTSAAYAHIDNYSWSSYDFMHTGTKTGTDAHTFIHETGHQLGLDDYYSYDNPARSPLGGLDMMDNNILDDDSMSKYNLDWITPTIAEANKTYTLKPFESSGDALILAKGFNGTCFDEYFIMEYYTPTGLNELDSTTRYDNSPLGFTIPGLKILHADQRIGKFVYSSTYQEYRWDNHYYSNVDPITSGNQAYEIISSNTPSYCYDSKNYALISLVQASGLTNLMKSDSISVHNALNTDLFTTSSNVFGNSVYKNYITDEGFAMNNTVNISSLTSTGITLTIGTV
jgi:M6 family metalloprotease-like protein